MIDLSTLRLQDHHHGINWAELEALFALAELGGRSGDKLRRAFLNSTAVCYAFDQAMLVGVSRAISDGEYHAVIYDVAVHPEYQRLGVGRLVMSQLLSRLPVWRVMLIASSDVQPFYRQLGFAPYPDAMARLDWSQLVDSTGTSDSP